MCTTPFRFLFLIISLHVEATTKTIDKIEITHVTETSYDLLLTTTDQLSYKATAISHKELPSDTIQIGSSILLIQESLFPMDTSQSWFKIFFENNGIISVFSGKSLKKPFTINKNGYYPVIHPQIFMRDDKYYVRIILKQYIFEIPIDLKYVLFIIF